MSSSEKGVGWKANGSEGYGDTGGASRFFYTTKASKKEKEAGLEVPDQGRANTHPTVKPLDLMQYLVRLVCPAGGTVLEPFLGSGSTLCACALEKVDAVGIELDSDYVEIAKNRIAHWGGQAEQVEVKKQSLEDLPLFKGIL